MKTLQFILLISIFSFTSFTLKAQTKKTETFNVSGNCGMCKSRIEKAAKAAGASFASWNEDTKKITVKYNKDTDLLKIQQKIADAGYDNDGAKAPDTAYSKLDECCQYDRSGKKDAASKE